MSRYRIVHSAVHAAIAALCWLVLRHINQLEAYIDNYKPIFTEYKGYAVSILIGLLALLFRVSDKLGNALIESVPLFSRLLRRFLSRGDFIEGDWPLIVVDKAERKLLYVGFLTISFRQMQIYVYGNDCSPDGRHAMEFHSKQSLYADRRLQYWYEQGPSLHRPEMRGFTEIFFFPRMSLPQRHAGSFLDHKHNKEIRFYAVRRNYRLLEPRLRSKEQQLEAARALWAKLEPSLHDLDHREISTDFE